MVVLSALGTNVRPVLVGVVDGAERLLAADLLSQAAPGSHV